MPYSEVTVTGYNANPPPDDGTAVSDNEVSWSKHKTKIGDPLKAAIDSTQANITTAVNAIETSVTAAEADIDTLQAEVQPVSRGGTGQTTEAEAIGELTQALTENAFPDRTLDFVGTYDADVDTGKKVALYKVAGVAVVDFGTISAAAAVDIAIDGLTQFKSFKLILRDIIPATDGAIPWLRGSDDGGSTFEADASDYKWVFREEELTTVEANAVVGDGADSEIELSSGVGNAAGEFGSFEIEFDNPQGTSLNKMIRWKGNMIKAAGTDFGIIGWGKVLANAAVTDIRFMFSTGNITSGSYTLLGII